MPSYMFAYHGGKKPETKEQAEEEMAGWYAWIERHNSAMENPGSPVGMSKTVSKDGVRDDGGANPLMGFSIVRAESMEAVLEIAKDCPFIEMGSIEVAEIMEM